MDGRMTQDEIIELAKQAGLMADGEMWFSPTYGSGDVHISHLQTFAKLVAEKEREACAKVCEEMSNTQANMNVAWRNGCRDAATEIRARGQA
jgi:hypothetical protein